MFVYQPTPLHKGTNAGTQNRTEGVQCELGCSLVMEMFLPQLKLISCPISSDSSKRESSFRDLNQITVTGNMVRGGGRGESENGGRERKGGGGRNGETKIAIE